MAAAAPAKPGVPTPAPFDPDAYLAEKGWKVDAPVAKPAPAFDPDAYLAEKGWKVEAVAVKPAAAFDPDAYLVEKGWQVEPVVAGSPPSGAADDEEEALPVPGAKEGLAARPGALLGGLLADPAGAPSAPAEGFQRGDAKYREFAPGEGPMTKGERKEWDMARQLAAIGRERGQRPGGPVDVEAGALAPMAVAGAQHAAAVTGKALQGLGKVLDASVHLPRTVMEIADAVAHPLRTVDGMIEAVTREVSADEEKLMRREAKIKGTTYEKLLEQRRKERGAPPLRAKVPIEMAPVPRAVVKAYKKVFPPVP